MRILGPIVGLVLFTIFSSLPFEPRLFLAIFSTVIWWWLFTDIPLFVSGLMGVGVSSIFSLAPASEIFSPLADPLIFLFLGGFLLARALANLRFDQRIALILLNLKVLRSRPHLALIALMVMTLVFSMWISNTATIAMMIPLATGMLASLKINDQKTRSLLLLYLAYSATLGGTLTPLGSPPNLVAIGFLKSLADVHVSFFGWTARAMVVTIPLFVFLIFQFKRSLKIELSLEAFQETLGELVNSLPPFDRRQKYLLTIFLLTVIAWILPGVFALLGLDSLRGSLNPGAVAICSAGLLFLYRSKANSSESFILTAEDLRKIDWGALLLLGSGLSLGKLLFTTGLADLMGGQIQMIAAYLSWPLLLLILITFTIFFTELSSNTAAANILVPLMILTAIKLEVSPTVLGIGVALACNFAFMLPVATPPNTLVYGTSEVPMKLMVRQGFILNLAAIVILWAMLMLLS